MFVFSYTTQMSLFNSTMLLSRYSQQNLTSILGIIYTVLFLLGPQKVAIYGLMLFSPASISAANAFSWLALASLSASL
jgi:hypothetical protein